MDIEWARDGDDGKLYIVQARPETVFTVGQLPNEGIGLARLESVINDAIGMYPKALLNYDPRHISVRLSDSKSNEHKSLIGSDQSEPDEENPVFAFRGCGRYTDHLFEEYFAMELVEDASQPLSEGLFDEEVESSEDSSI